MKARQRLHDLGQSLWLDNVTRGLLTKGTLRHYITELSVTWLTSNPTIFDRAIKSTEFYNDAIIKKIREGKSGEELFFELALEDLTQAADLFRPIHDATDGVDNAALAAQLQREGAQSFAKSWNDLMDTIASKSHVPGKTIQPGGNR